MKTSLIIKLILLTILFSLSINAKSAVVEDIRMWHAPERSRFVFDIDKEPNYKVYTLKSPDRLVVDLNHSTLGRPMPPANELGPYIGKMRSGKPNPNTLRVVFELAKPIRYELQLLKPFDRYQYRLVIDFYDKDHVQEQAPTLASVTTPRQNRERTGDILIVIDAGHGGEDPGAVGKRSYEKTIVLSVAKKLKKMIDKEPGLRAELTRTGDYYISLRRRTIMARNMNADLFISVHADGHHNTKAQGASVYALSQRGATSETARWLADKENSADLSGGVSLSEMDDLLAKVLLDLSMTHTVSESVSFGMEVLDELKKIGKIHSKRVEQAGFAVLKSPDIPSILVETAYITNPSEEKMLGTKSHQTKLATAITNGVKRYLRKNQGIYAYKY
ncbi:MAG: N-acetylmuramoyl-L-alanine amidase [Gammaproteobacteria bacterium]|nr:N-acetylmuramoyl-L-alanine amidase [Gammaproteobacteria bacterium]